MVSVDRKIDDSDNFKFFGLGGCNEVGRSCHIIEYKNKVIMLDAGVHPGLSGHASFPFYDEYDLSRVDILLISHFHLDHAGSLPYVMQHTNFKGKVYMTHATKAIYRWLLQDYVRVTSIGGGNRNGVEGADAPAPGMSSTNLYTDEDIMNSFDRIHTIDYHSTMEVDGVRFTAFHAGHVLGSCMYFIEIGGLKILFTGDYSRTENRHLQAAEIPPTRPDILISEATFGTGTLEPRVELENRLTSSIHATLAEGGRVLLPVFALGTAQELLLILEDYWSRNEDLQNVNIYYASNLAKKCMAVYQTYTNIMNDNIRLTALKPGQKSLPFDFKYIKSMKDLSKFQDFGPSVVLASPGMLQAGISRQLLERWAPDPKNKVIMTGFSVEGTMAKILLAEPHVIQSGLNPDLSIPRRIGIEELSFAAHVDFKENSDFIEKVAPSKIILVHGDSVPMGRLKLALLSKYSSHKNTELEVKVFNPKNCDDLFIPIKGMKMAKVLGSLAEHQLGELKKQVEAKVASEAKEVEKVTEIVDLDDNVNDVGDPKQAPENDVVTIKNKQIVRGVLVAKDFDLNLLQIQDLNEFSQLSTSIVKLKINLKINADILLIKWHLEQMFGYVNVINDDEEEWECVVMDMIDILVDRSKLGASYVTVEWINDNLMADSLADSVVAILYSTDTSPASVKISSVPCSHTHTGTGHADTSIETRVHRISSLLEAQFGDAFTQGSGNTATIVIGKTQASIDYMSLAVECTSKVLRDRIKNVLKRGSLLAAPLSQYHKTV